MKEHGSVSYWEMAGTIYSGNMSGQIRRYSHGGLIEVKQELRIEDGELIMF